MFWTKKANQRSRDQQHSSPYRLRQNRKSVYQVEPYESNHSFFAEYRAIIVIAALGLASLIGFLVARFVGLFLNGNVSLIISCTIAISLFIYCIRQTWRL